MNNAKDPPVPRHGQGLSFDSPDGNGRRIMIGFANPIDGGPPFEGLSQWEREGDTFEDLVFTVREPRFSCGPFSVLRGWVFLEGDKKSPLTSVGPT